MGWWQIIINFLFCVCLVNCAVILNDDVEEQGLYNSKTDKVTILVQKNFDRKLYGKKYAQLVQFYNSYCGHCRNFYPKFKTLAYEVLPWKQLFRVAVIDCFNEENNEVCREFEVTTYPSLRYVHENYKKRNDNIGERIKITETVDQLFDEIIDKLQSEQKKGRFVMAPDLNIVSFSSYDEVVENVPRDTLFTFLIFENANSTVGSRLVLDASSYTGVKVKRVNQYSELAQVARLQRFPAIIAVQPGRKPVDITPDNLSKSSLLDALKSYLKTHNYKVPENEIEEIIITERPNPNNSSVDTNRVYYSDLEKTVKSILHTEINHLNLNTESRTALINLLKVLRDFFPFKGNQQFKSYIEELLYNVQVFSGQADELTVLVKNLENKHRPYRSLQSDYIGCKGSEPRYRGYTCGLWTLFHTLTVGAANHGGSQAGPSVLHAMHGFVKYFFGCTHCVQHFLKMAENNRLFDVKDNDKAVLWLWVSHNEVNLRLAGDLTEDPAHPKLQFPSVNHCRQCRMKSGAWDLQEVYQYLLTFYGSENIQDGSENSSADTLSQLSNLDLGMLSFLYILSFIIIILVIKLFLTKRFYRKRIYKNGRGKV